MSEEFDLLEGDIKTLYKRIEALEEQDKECSETHIKYQSLFKKELTKLKEKIEELEKKYNETCKQIIDDIDIIDMIAELEGNLETAFKLIRQLEGETESFNERECETILESIPLRDDSKPDQPNKCSECGGYRMGEYMVHNDGCSQCITTTTTAEKPDSDVINVRENVKFLTNDTYIVISRELFGELQDFMGLLGHSNDNNIIDAKYAKKLYEKLREARRK